jgi:outer membrane protein assembly factor BamB
MVIGYRVETTTYDSELDKQLDYLRFICTGPYGLDEQKYNCYKEKLLMEYSSDNSNNDLVIKQEHEESKIPIDLPSVSMVGGPMDSPWPMKCHNNRHTGQSPYSTADNPYIEKWRYHCDWMEDSAIIDNNGTIYFGDLGRWFYAIYPNGGTKWKYKTGNMIWSAPAIAEDGTIYVGSWDCRLYAFYQNGTLKWRFPASGSISSSLAIAEDGTIYFGGFGGYIYAVNPNGTEKWRYKTGDWITSDPAIGDDGTIYIGSMDDYFYALYPNGTLKWRFLIGDRIYGSPSIADDGTIYIGSSWNSYLYALYPDGTLKWNHAGAGTPNNPSIGNDGTIYAGYLYNLIALNPDGSVKWNFYFGGNRYIGTSAPAISADGTIYIGINIGVYRPEGGELLAINPDGTEKWRQKISDSWIESSPIIAEDGTVYIGSSYHIDAGYLHAFGNVDSNNPPNAPSISGKTNGWVRKEHGYIFIAKDPDRNAVTLFVDWGDGNSGWLSRWYASGEWMRAGYTWTEKGTYTIKAKAKDVFGEESDWAELTVYMPRNRTMTNLLLLRFLEQFPILQKILGYIL